MDGEKQDVTTGSLKSVKRFYMRSLRFRYAYLAATVIIAALLLYVSTLPYERIERSFYPQISDLFDALNHFAGFFIFNMLLMSTIIGIFRKNIKERGCFLFFIMGIGWGLLCEGSQYFNSTRSFQLLDIVANTLPILPVYLFLKKVHPPEQYGGKNASAIHPKLP